MLEIIPAIDLIDGKCVRLTRGDFATPKIYNDNPLEVAKKFEAAGLRRLHIVDLDGAKNGKIANLSILEKIATGTTMEIDFGGGVKTPEDVRAIFNAGAKLAGIGSLAVKSPEVFASLLDEFGNSRILLSADVRLRKIAINAWEYTTEINLDDFLNKWSRRRGIRQILCTDISRDGTLEGAAVELYQQIHAVFPEIYLIASGGICSVEDFDKLKVAGCAAAIVGKAIYENRITLAEIENYQKKAC